MKKLSTAFIVLGALIATAPAFAADMALKAAPPPAPVWSWNGWYAGLNAGGSFGTARDSTTFAGAPFGTSSGRLDGFVGGGQIGYNWQSNIWVYGLEADIQGTSERNSANTAGFVPAIGCALLPCAAAAAVVDTEKLPWFGTVRARLGVLGSPTWLLYATGGLAYGEIDSTAALTIGAATTINSFNTTRAGWTAGGGVEAALGNNWTGKIEYLYLNFGSFTNTVIGLGPASPFTLTTHVTDNIVRVGVNYHFH
jgi:outer membrane immunogenic protein